MFAILYKAAPVFFISTQIVHSTKRWTRAVKRTLQKEMEQHKEEQEIVMIRRDDESWTECHEGNIQDIRNQLEEKGVDVALKMGYSWKPDHTKGFDLGLGKLDTRLDIPETFENCIPKWPTEIPGKLIMDAYDTAYKAYLSRHYDIPAWRFSWSVDFDVASFLSKCMSSVGHSVSYNCGDLNREKLINRTQEEFRRCLKQRKKYDRGYFELNPTIQEKDQKYCWFPKVYLKDVPLWTRNMIKRFSVKNLEFLIDQTDAWCDRWSTAVFQKRGVNGGTAWDRWMNAKQDWRTSKVMVQHEGKEWIEYTEEMSPSEEFIQEQIKIRNTADGNLVGTPFKFEEFIRERIQERGC